MEARRSGTEWANWLKTSAEKYEKAVGQQSAQETMVRLAQESLDTVQKSPDSLEYTDLRDEQSELNEQANLLSEKIDQIADETDRISNRLVFSLADSISLEQDSESIISEYHHRKEEAERLEKIREHENKTPYYVTEPYDKQDPGREIVMVSDVVGQEDQTISVNPHHPEIPEKTREKLKQMEVNTRYQILFEYDSSMNRYVKKIVRVYPQNDFATLS